MSEFTSIGAAAARVVEGLRPARPGVETWPVTDRAAWLARRQQDVTASSAGCLLGVHRWTTAFELAALKRGLIDDPEESKTMQAGRLLEDDILQVAAEERPSWRIWQPGLYYRDPEKRIGATPDSFAIDPEREGFGILQVKLVDSWDFQTEWKQDDEIVPPIWIAVQALIEAHLTGASWAAVAPGYVKRGLHVHLVDVPLHPGLIDRIEQEVAAFWRLVDAGQMPDPDYGRDGAVIAAVHAPDDSLPPADLTGWNEAGELIAERDAIAERAKLDKDRKSAIDAEITARLAGATVGILPDGRRVTRKLQTRREHIVPASTFPVIRISRGAA